MSSTITFWRLGVDALRTVRLDEQGRPDTDGRPVAELLSDLARLEDWELLEELLDEPERLGLAPVGDEFRTAWAFYDDIRRRMPSLEHSPWLPLLGEGPRLPPSATDDPALADLLVPGWVVLDASEGEQLRAAAGVALGSDPDWATDGSGNGPSWSALQEDLESRPVEYLLVLVR